MPRTSITYHLPGGLKATYSGDPMSYWRWLSKTWYGAIGAWRLWFGCWMHLACASKSIPSLKVVAEMVPQVVQRIIDKAMAENP